jgi:DHA2 family multidrug resistance protein
MSCSYRLAPDVSFNELMFMRAARVVGLACLSALLTLIAFVNMNREDNDEASALFLRSRNVPGSIGISLSIALIIDRIQARMAH